ncbi:MAG: CHASE2 domain-containing protein [Alphaproteobacteria bacterium]|nr:CHASE2 domain-containing protein [Alphaproteobacteria bacterium]MCB9931500.1 CHASE2 domain-containing protein [Alphaproteobacteria bacterium]
MATRLRRFPLSPLALVLLLAVAGLIALAMRLAEPDYGLPWLYAFRGQKSAPPEALVVGLDKAGVDWLAFSADRLETEAPGLAACLPASVRRELARASNVEDLPRGLLGCLFQALGALDPTTVVIDIHFYGTTDAVNDSLLEQGLRHLHRPILLEKVQAASLGGAAVRERPAARFRAVSQPGFFVVEWRDGDTFRYVASQPDFPGLRSFPSLAAEAEGVPLLLPGTAEPHFRLLNFYGPSGTVETVSFLDILTGHYTRSLAGRVVFVGASHPKGIARRDDFETAWSSSGGGDLAGVELAATGFLNLLHGEALYRLPGAGDWAAAMAVGLAMLALAVAITGFWGAVAALLVAAVYVVAAGAAFASDALWLPIAAVLYAFAPLSLLAAIGLGYRQTSAVLYRLLPRRIAVALVHDHSRTRSDALVTDATVMVVDLVSSTALAEGMSETEYNQKMTQFFNLLNRSVEAHGGMVLKYTGDGIMAVFEARRRSANHAEQALDSAVAIARALDSAAQTGPALHVRMGINSGRIAVGEIGADTRSSIDAMGDAVNVAARLEQMAKQDSDANRTVILVADATIRLTDQWLERSIPVGKRTIRGRQGEVWVFQLEWRPASPS